MNYETGVHIGDGVYVKFDGYHVVLMANNPVTDTIYLDHHVRRALVRAIEQIDNLPPPPAAGDDPK